MIEQIPKDSGAYVLFFNLYAPHRLDIARLGYPRAPAGAYAYCGSARGPGGLRARIARHLRPHKSVHWHIDRLSAAGRVTAVAHSSTVSECDLLGRLLAIDGASIPIPGFGSSDCRDCPSHLVRIQTEPETAFLSSDAPPGSRTTILSVPN